MRISALFLIKTVLTALLCAVSLARASHAMSVEPLVLDLSTAGKNATQSFRVSNEATSPLPVEIVVTRLEIGPNGQTSYKPASDEFLIYPPQANIPSGGAQNFRVQWIGEPDLKVSRNYRFAVSQVPVKQPKGTSGIQISLSFGVIVGIAAPDMAPAMSVTGAALKTEGSKRLAAVKVKNTGGKHGYLRKAALSFTGGNWSTKLSAYEVEQKVGLGIVQPGKERIFLIPLDVPPGVTQISATLDYQPEE
jgi:fimbrial chaperone protein